MPDFDDLTPERLGPQAAEETTAEAAYFPISSVKFAVLSLLTLGIYKLYWFYRNWLYIKGRDGSDIWPFWRAVFSVIWCYPLIRDIRDHSDGSARAAVEQAAVITGAYVLLAMTVRLPDPYWMIALFDFVPILAVVNAINSMNIRSSSYAYNSKIRLRTVGVAALFAPMTALAAAMSIGLVPGTTVVTGDKVPARHADWMVEQGLLEDQEQMLYFYSTGFLSYREDGNVVTDLSVISYWQDEGELYGDYAYYDEISEIIPEYSESWIDDTIITIRKHDGAEFIVLASIDQDLDHRFVQAMRERVAASQLND